MGTKDPRVDAYIAKSADFAKPILNHLRRLVHEGCPEVEEAFKWSFPCFMYKGILCSMAAFRQHCTFGFWKHELLFPKQAPAQAEDDGMGQFGKMTSAADLPKDAVLLKYIKEAKRLNDEGVKVPSRSGPKKPVKFEVPDYFLTALNKNKAALKNFEKFSPSHKKEYVEWLTEAKRDETRRKRLATTLAWLAEGKPRHWKYVNC
jgi:uncharacterized protein YdeI (YjbR/CyaY-like superfamily)